MVRFMQTAQHSPYNPIHFFAYRCILRRVFAFFFPLKFREAHRLNKEHFDSIPRLHVNLLSINKCWTIIGLSYRWNVLLIWYEYEYIILYWQFYKTSASICCYQVQFNNWTLFAIKRTTHSIEVSYNSYSHLLILI